MDEITDFNAGNTNDAENVWSRKVLFVHLPSILKPNEEIDQIKINKIAYKSDIKNVFQCFIVFLQISFMMKP